MREITSASSMGGGPGTTGAAVGTAAGAAKAAPRAAGVPRWPGCTEKLTVAVIVTGIGCPLRIDGVNSHWRTASSAAASRSGIDRMMTALVTLPSVPIVAWTYTML